MNKIYKAKHKPFTTILLLIFILLLSSCAQTDNKKVLKLAHTLPTDHPVHEAMAFMGKRVAELSDNKIQIEIYPSGQLGSEQQCVELVQIGSLAITKVSTAVMESFAEDYNVLGMPYLFSSREHMFEVLGGEIGQEILLSTEEKLMHGLCFYDAGARSFYTIDKPILKPEDLAGMKIRVMKSKIALEMVKALGGLPTPISFGELYTALQSGVVDGAENNPPSFYTSHHYEVCKYYSLDEHSAVPDVLIMSQVIWDGLNEEERQWLMQAVNESVELQHKLWLESEIESLEKVKKAGVEIFYPEKAPFREKVEVVYEKYADNEIISNYIKRIRALED